MLGFGLDHEEGLAGNAALGLLLPPFLKDFLVGCDTKIALLEAC